MGLKSILRFLWIVLLLDQAMESAFAENVLTIDRHFTGTSLGRALNYLKSTDSQGHPQNREYLRNNRHIFHAVGEHHFHQLTIENTESYPLDLVIFSEIPLGILKLQNLDSTTPPHLGGKLYGDNQIPQSILTATSLFAPPGQSTYEIETSRLQNIGATQLFLWTEKNFKIYEKESIIYISLIFGAVISLFLYNIFLLTVNPSSLMIYFSICCFAVGMFESIISGANSVFSFYIYDYSTRLWPLYCTIGVTGFALFLSEVTTDQTAKRLKFWVRLSTGIANFISLNIILFQNHINHYASIAIVFAIVVVIGILPQVLGRFKLKDHLVFYSSIPLIGSTGFYILEMTSLISSDYNLLRIQLITAVLFLLSLSINAGNKTHEDRFPKIKLQEMITLGRNVQDLLLPKKLEETFKDLSYSFAYEPFEGKMSGDWIKHWKTSDGSHHFLLGDVTGKGPQAALAVSIISTVVDRCIRLDNNAKTALIQINKTLYSLLNGSMGSTASGATVRSDLGLVLYNTGGIGWILQKLDQSKHVLGRSSILGQKPYVDISEFIYKPHEWPVICTFTDGLCNGPRAIKQLSSHLLKYQSMGVNSHEIRKSALNISKIFGDPHDDKAFLVIKF